MAKPIAETVAELVRPITDELGLELWDVEFKKEGSGYFLRIYIDRDEGVSINDCEAVSRRIDPILDDADPIEQSYCLEVSSAGLIRELRTTAHLRKFIGHTVEVSFFKALDGTKSKKISAVLTDADDDTVTLETGGDKNIYSRKDISKIKIDLV